VLPAPVVHADLASASALALANKQRATARVEVAFVQVERLLDPQPGAPQDDNQRADPPAADTLTGSAHHSDDLLHSRRIGRVSHPLVPRRATEMELRERRRANADDRLYRRLTAQTRKPPSQNSQERDCSTARQPPPAS
jgi:hypothetical protein